jgi:hypothetical protein
MNHAGKTSARYVAAALLLGLIGAAATARAADNGKEVETYSGSKWMLSLGLYYPNVDTYIRVDGTGGILGAELDFDTLGLDKNEVLPELSIVWQINPKHAVWANYFELDRSGFTNTALEIRVGDTIFPVNSNLDAQFSSKVLSAGYGYQFINDADKFIGFRIGLNVQDVSFGLANENGLFAETADVTAPLPTFGLVGGYRLGENWNLGLQAGYLGLTVDQYEGAVTEMSARLDYRLGEHVSLGLSYQYLKVDVKSEDEKWMGRLRYEYYGPALQLGYRF